MSALTFDVTGALPDRTRVATGVTVAALGGAGLLASLVSAVTDPAAAVVLATAPIGAIVAVVGLRIAGPRDARSFRLFRR